MKSIIMVDNEMMTPHFSFVWAIMAQFVGMLIDFLCRVILVAGKNTIVTFFHPDGFSKYLIPYFNFKL